MMLRHLKILLTCAVVSLAFTTIPTASFADGSYVDGIWVDDGEHIRTLVLPASDKLTVNGWTRRGRGDVYRLKVNAGDEITVALSSKSPYVLMAIFDFARPDEDAIYFSEANDKTAVIKMEADGELLIRPIHILSSSRRGLGANYQLVISK